VSDRNWRLVLAWPAGAWIGQQIAVLVLAIALAAAVAFVPLPVLVLGVLGAITGVLALTTPEWAIAAIVLSVPLQRTLEIGDGLTATKVIVWTAAAGWLIRQWLTGGPITVDAIGFAWLAYVIVLVASIVPARDVGAWAGEVYRWAVALIVYVMARTVFLAGRPVAPVLLAIAGGTLGMSLLGAWQVVTHAGPPSFSAGGMTRAFGTFGEPNPLAGYLEMTLPVLLAVIVSRLALRDGPSRAAGWLTGLALLTWVVGSAILVLTQSRGGLAGMAVGTGVVLWLSGGHARRLGTVAVLALAVVTLALPVGGRLMNRFGSAALSTGTEAQVTVGNFASLERAAHWRAAIAMAERNPVLGVGAGNFNARYREMTTVWRFRIPRGHAHNAYLQALAQAGMLGFLAYLGLLGAVARAVWRQLRLAGPGTDRSLIIGAAGVTAAVAVHNLVEYLHVLSLGLQLAVVWALAASRPSRDASPRALVRASRGAGR
jgi:O-antigen ligase